MKFVLSLVAATVLALNVSAQSLEEIREKYNTAGAAMTAKDFVKAAALFTEVIQQGATVEGAEEMVAKTQTYLPVCIFQIGVAEAKAKNYDEALKKLTEARDRAEMGGNLQIQRQATQLIGQVYYAMGADAYNNDRFAEAVEVFSKGFEADDRNTTMALNLARSYDRLDSLDKAVVVYQAVIALEGEHDRYVEPAAEAKKELAQAVLVRAIAAGGENNLEEVIRLTDLIPTDPAGALLRVQVANNKKDYRSVIEFAPAAAELQSEPEKKSDIYFLLGTAYQNTENLPKAIESFRKVTAGTYVAQAKNMITELSK
jgi:tetratricopeptide (TPR) repeat protein